MRRGGYFATLAGAAVRPAGGSLRPPRRLFAPEPVLLPAADWPGEPAAPPRDDAPGERPRAVTRSADSGPQTADAPPPSEPEGASVAPRPPPRATEGPAAQRPAAAPYRMADPAPVSEGRSPTRATTIQPPGAESRAERPGEPHAAFRPAHRATPIAVPRKQEAIDGGRTARPPRTPRLQIGAIDVTVVPPREPDAPPGIAAPPARPRPLVGPARPSPWFGLAQR
jgi:hypothetical protein